MPAHGLNPSGHPVTATEVDGAPAADVERGWWQISMWCADRFSAEQAALTALRPALEVAREELALWWFVRKGSSWRIRLHPTGYPGPVVEVLTSALVASIQVRDVTSPIYEPETVAFGGPTAMALAHELFAADSGHLLTHLARTSRSGARAHRRELGVLFSARLMRAAGLDWYEQGDVWQRLAAHRQPAWPHRDQHPDPATVRGVTALLTATGEGPASPLRAAPAWGAAFDQAGEQLAAHAHAGQLGRGLRSVLAHHLLFLFNRLGVPGAEQHGLAAAAVHTIFREDHHMPAVSAPAEPPADADHLRSALVAHIRGRGTFKTDTVERAFQRVPRHVFLPGIDLTEAYAPRPVVTKRGENGAAVSSASSPNLVAEMLELLAINPGDRVLEIGAATGINAALLAEITGENGHVTTVEIDQDLTDGARQALDAAGYPGVVVHCGDGALGHPDTAPFDRIIVTAGAWDIPQAWWDQLAPEGRLVVPVRLHGSGLTRVLPLDLEADQAGDHTADDARSPALVARTAAVCGFVPMRGTDEHPEDVVRLDADVVLAVERSDRPDADALGCALRDDPVTRWTGITVDHDEPAEHLDLWLATTADPSTTLFGRLRVGNDARAAGVVTPALRWAGAALYRDGTFAYLAARDHDDTNDELGITAHGPEAAALIDQLHRLLGRWAHERPAQPTITAFRTNTSLSAPRTRNGSHAHGRDHDIVRDRTRFTVSW